MDTYTNKWHPWIQTRNNPKHFSPSLSPHTSPAAGFIPHTHSIAAHRFLSEFHHNGPQELSEPGLLCCSKGTVEQGVQELKLSRAWGVPLTGTCLPSSFSLVIVVASFCILAPGKGCALGLPHFADVADTSQPPALAHPLDLEGLLLWFAQCRDKDKPWNSNRTSHFELCFPPCSNPNLAFTRNRRFSGCPGPTFENMFKIK